MREYAKSREVGNLAYEIEEAITDVLIAKTLKAAEMYKVKSILVGGGVAANQRLSEKFNEKVKNLRLHIPPPNLCTDNAAYIGAYAYYFNTPVGWEKMEARPDLSVEGRHSVVKQ